MRHHILTWGLVLPVAAVASQGPPGQPGKPEDTAPLGIHLAQANCQEAVEALRTGTRLPLQLDPTAAGQADPARTRARLADRYSFDWKQASPGDALDTLTQRFGLHLAVRPGGLILLTPAADPQECRPVRPAGLVEIDGLRIGVSRGDIRTSVPARFLDQQLQLGLEVRPRSRDESSIAHISNVAAVDDRGRVLTDRDMHTGPARPQTRPGVCTFEIALPAPHPLATRLVSIQGELFTYRRFSRHRVEIPLPLRRNRNRWREGDLGFELLSVRSGAASAPADPGDPVPGGTAVVGRLSFPLGIELGEELSRAGGTGTPFPLLIGASGRIYGCRGAKSTAQVGAEEREQVVELEWSFPPIEEPLSRLEFHLLRREAPERLGTFRLRDIPLPRQPRSEPAVPVSLTTSRLTADHPLFRQGGAALVSRIRLGGQPAPAGTLYLGFAIRSEQGLSATEWFEAPVKGGLAVLSGLRPGSYRLLRLYRPGSGDGDVPGGVWRGFEINLVVPPQGKANLPALELQKGAAFKPQPGGAVPPLPAAPEVRKEPAVTVSDVQFALSEQRSVRFLNPPDFRHIGSTRVTLSGRSGPEYSDRLAQVSNIVARDDHGRLLTAATVPVNQSHRLWLAGLLFPFPGSGVKRLDWIEGDLHYWSRVEPIKVEIPLTTMKQEVRRQVGPVRVEFKLTPGEDDDELRKAGPAQAKGLRVSGAITAPPTVRLEAPDGEQLRVVLIDASGESHALASGSSGLERGGEGTRYRINGWFPALEVPAARLKVDWVLKSELRKAGSFRVTNLELPVVKPLPERPPGEPAPSRPASFAEMAAPPPYRAGRGGTVVLQVRTGEGVAGGGTLSVGLTRMESGGRGALRWIDLPVSSEGTARLVQLRPGTYRLVRRYRPALSAPDLAGGQWSRAEVEVRVQAGKAVLLPPLHWLPKP